MVLNSVDDVYNVMCMHATGEHDPDIAKARLQKLKETLEQLNNYELAFICICSAEKRQIEGIIHSIKRNREE